MTVALRLYRKGAEQPTLLGEREFEEPRVTIGRGADCSLVLEDPKKWVSRVHAELVVEAGQTWLTVMSKVNPVFVNGERHGPGSRFQVHAGDRLEIGEYEIDLVPPPAPVAAEPVQPPAAEATLIVEPAPELDFVLEAGNGAAAAAAETTGSQEVTAPQTVPVLEPRAPVEMEPKAPQEPEPTPTLATRATVPEENIFTEATTLGATPPPELFAEPTVIGTETPAKEALSVEDSVLLEVTQLRSSLPPPESGIFEEAEAPAGEKIEPEVPAALVEPSPEPQAAVAPEARAEPPATDAEPARTESALFAEPTVVRAPSPAGSLEGLERAVKAFLDGAGLGERALASPEEMEQFLRQSGAIVRAAVDGVMALLAARAEAKKEFRAEDRTMVASRDNNPLKLMADPREAIDFLLDTKERSGGFLPPVQAVADAFDDVRAHEAALIAGMRAAILGALRRFDPKTLEEEFAKASGGLGLNRKAKLWDLFCAYQQKLAREAEDDFNKVFGRDFIASYMAQVKRLRGK
jgi:type VI secretion system FHA domain protein